MSTLRELKWFLGIYVLRERSQRLLQLLQEAYIKKIANQYEIDLKGRLLDTPMAESELLPTAHQSIRLTCPSPNTDLLVYPISLPREAASTMLYQLEELRKERTVEGETKEYAIKDETMVETVEVKRNHLSVPAMHYLRTTPSIERARKGIL